MNNVRRDDRGHPSVLHGHGASVRGCEAWNWARALRLSLIIMISPTIIRPAPIMPTMPNGTVYSLPMP